MMSEAQVLHEFSMPFDGAELEQVDLRALRAGFAELGDTAAEAVFRDGLDLDDVILERWADVKCDSSAKGRLVRIDWLSDRELCVKDVRRQCLTGGDAGRIAIVALRVRVVRGPVSDPFGASHL